MRFRNARATVGPRARDASTRSGQAETGIDRNTLRAPTLANSATATAHLFASGNRGASDSPIRTAGHDIDACVAEASVPS